MKKKRSITKKSVLKEPSALYTTSSKIRSIGNSKGVILSLQVIEEAGIPFDANVIIKVTDGEIIIKQDKSFQAINTDLSTWELQFKKAIKHGNKSEADLWGGIQNHFDEEEWT